MDVLLWRRKVRAWLRHIQRRVCHKLRDLCTNVVVTMQPQMLPSLTHTKKFRSAQQQNSCTQDNLYQTPHGRQRGTRSYVADEYKRMTNCRGAQLLSKSRRCIVAAHKWIDANVGEDTSSQVQPQHPTTCVYKRIIPYISVHRITTNCLVNLPSWQSSS